MYAHAKNTIVSWVRIGIKTKKIHKNVHLLLSFVGNFFLPPLVRGGGKTVGFDGRVVFEDKLGAPSCNARSDGVAHCATPTTPQFHSLKRSFNSSPDKGSQEFSRPSASERRRSCTATPPDKGSQGFPVPLSAGPFYGRGDPSPTLLIYVSTNP